MADLVLVNGNILTMNESKPRAQAIAVKKNRIFKVGSNAEIKSLIANNTRILDLKGKTVVPGFIDTHVHVADLGRVLDWIDLTKAGSIEELLQLVRNKAARVAKGKWLLGSGWNNENVAEKRCPTKQDLDVAAPDNPVIIYHSLGQIAVVNSEALKLSGLTKETVSPEEGAVDRNKETGELTGILEGAATDLVWKKVPEPTAQEMLEAARIACKALVEAGITSVHWITTSARETRIVDQLGKDSSIPLRIFTIAAAKNLGSFTPQRGGKTRIRGALIFADGYLASKTAALNAPYVDNSINSGKLLCGEDGLDQIAMKVHKAGLQVVIHAMGDRAIGAAVKAFEGLMSRQSVDRNRLRMEQAALLNEQLIKDIERLKIIVSVQPKVVESEFSVWKAVENLGEKRAKLLFPIGTLLKNGICVVGGSDSPMEPISPLLGIQAAVSRKPFPEERLTIQEALKLYTLNAAFATNEEDSKGSIEVGKLADFTVLSEDPTLIPTRKLADIEVEMTIIDGIIVHQKCDL